MKKEITLHLSGSSRYPEEEKQPGKFYFELRTSDDFSAGTIIEDRVLFNNEGSIEATLDILADAVMEGLIQDRSFGVNLGDVYKIYEVVNIE